MVSTSIAAQAIVLQSKVTAIHLESEWTFALWGTLGSRIQRYWRDINLQSVYNYVNRLLSFLQFDYINEINRKTRKQYLVQYIPNVFHIIL